MVLQVLSGGLLCVGQGGSTGKAPSKSPLAQSMPVRMRLENRVDFGLLCVLWPNEVENSRIREVGFLSWHVLSALLLRFKLMSKLALKSNSELF